MIYLIAHKYCGEPTFDVANRMPCPMCAGTSTDVDTMTNCHECDGDGTWWILNDGHRAYPYAYWQLEDLADVSDHPHVRPWTYDDKMPDDARDAYEPRATPKINKQKVMASLDDILELL